MKRRFKLPIEMEIKVVKLNDIAQKKLREENNQENILDIDVFNYIKS